MKTRKSKNNLDDNTRIDLIIKSFVFRMTLRKRDKEKADKEKEKKDGDEEMEDDTGMHKGGIILSFVSFANLYCT